MATAKDKAPVLENVNEKQFALTMAGRYKQEPKVSVQISPLYRPDFGKVMPVVLNGVAIHIPVDGNSYEIPESYAMEVHQRIARVNAKFTRQGVLSDVTKNSESYAGELELVRK